MPLGTPWHEGAVRAARAALHQGAPTALVADLLGLLLLAEPKADSQAAAVAVLRERAERDESIGTFAIRGCVVAATRIAAWDDAQRCAQRGIALGRDSTWLSLELARSAFGRSEGAVGRRMFDSAIGTAKTSGDWEVIGWHLGWFLEPEEAETWLTLEDSTRATWIRDRLAARDIRDGRSVGSRIEEHFRRLGVADSTFRYTIPTRSVARFKHAATPETLPEAVKQIGAWHDPGLVPAEPFRNHQRYDPRYDDRAATYMRFGEPTKRIRWHGRDTATVVGRAPMATGRAQDNPARGGRLSQPNGTNTREAWLYEIDGQGLLLHYESERFTGTLDATRFVTGVLGHYLCDVDSRRCTLSMRSQMAFDARFSAVGLSDTPLAPEHVATLREADREHLTQATTRDDHGVRTARTITTLARLHRVWDPASGAVLGVVPWAVRTRDVAERHDTATTFVVTVRQWDPGTGAWLEATVPRAIRLPPDRPSDGYLTGHAVVASAPGVSAWSVIAAQDSSAWGRAWADRSPPLGGGALAISDVVLGAESQGQRWRTTGGTEVPLAPLGAFDRGEPVTVYWQVRSATTRDSLRTSVAFYRIGVRGEEPALQIAYTARAARGLTELLREVGIAQLPGGEYRLEVVVTDPADGATARRSGQLLVK